MIQIDMKMPEYCDDCPMLDEYGDYPMCRITQETRGYTFNASKKRMDKCPMKPVEAVPLESLCEWLAGYADPPKYAMKIIPESGEFLINARAKAWEHHFRNMMECGLMEEER